MESVVDESLSDTNSLSNAYLPGLLSSLRRDEDNAHENRSPLLPRPTFCDKGQETYRKENDSGGDDALSHTSEILVPTSLLMLTPRRHKSTLEISSCHKLEWTLLQKCTNDLTQPIMLEDAALQPCSEETVNGALKEHVETCENNPLDCQQAKFGDKVSQWLVDQSVLAVTGNEEGENPIYTSQQFRDFNMKRVMERHEHEMSILKRTERQLLYVSVDGTSNDDLKQTLRTLQPLLLSLQKTHDSESREISDALRSAADAQAKSLLVLQAKLVHDRQELLVALFNTHLQLAARVRSQPEAAVVCNGLESDDHVSAAGISRTSNSKRVYTTTPGKAGQLKCTTGAVKRSASLTSAEQQRSTMTSKERKVSQRPRRAGISATLPLDPAAADESVTSRVDISMEDCNASVEYVDLTAEEVAMEETDLMKDAGAGDSISASPAIALRLDGTSATQQETDFVLSHLQAAEQVTQQQHMSTQVDRPLLPRASVTNLTNQQQLTPSPSPLCSEDAPPPHPLPSDSMPAAATGTSDKCDDIISQVVAHKLPKKKAITLKRLLNANIIQAANNVLFAVDQSGKRFHANLCSDGTITDANSNRQFQDLAQWLTASGIVNKPPKRRSALFQLVTYNGVPLSHLATKLTETTTGTRLPSATTIQQPTLANQEKLHTPATAIIVLQQPLPPIPSVGQPDANTELSRFAKSASNESSSQPLPTPVVASASKLRSVLLFSDSELFPWRPSYSEDFWSRNTDVCDLHLFADIDVW